MKKVPKLRFKEFNEEWVEKRLGDIVSIKSGKSPTDLINENGTIPYFKVEQLNNSNKYQIKTPYKILFNEKDIIKKGSIIFPKRGIAILLNKVRIIAQDSFIDTNLMSLTCDLDVLNEFLYYIILKNNLSKIADTTSIPQINNKHIEPYIVIIPNIQEQEKIANFLSSVDKKISLTEEKLNLFKEYKKGIMQKIFSQELRFKDSNGNSYPNWEEKKIENIFFAKSSSISQSTLENNNGNYAIYGATGKIKNINFYENKNEYIGIIKDGAGVGRTFLCEKKSSVLGTLNYLEIINDKAYLKFGYYLLNQIDFSKYIVGSSIPHIYFKDYKNEKINLPCLEEQKKIADFLSSIDNKIEKIENEVESLKEFKKGLLQQMFV